MYILSVNITMKSSVITTACVAVILSLSVSAKDDHSIPTQIIESQIQTVMVYPDSAKVTRGFGASIPAGESTIRLHYLPTELDTDNVKTEILTSQSNAMVRDISFNHNFVKVEDHPEVVRLKAKVDLKSEEVKEVQKQLDLLNRRLAFAKSLAESFTSGYGSKEGELPTAEAIESTWQFYETTYWEVDSKMKDLETSLKPLQEALKTLNAESLELVGELKRSTLSVSILLDSSSATSVDMLLSYIVGNCSWEPVYEIRAYPEEKDVSMRYQVNVFQNSGETWNDVKLTLSSARANTSSHIPELYPINLNKMEPMMMRTMSAKSMQMEQDSVMLMAAPPMEAEMAMPSFAANYSSYQVTLPQTFSMKSGKDRKKSLIAERVVKGEFWTVIAPKSDTQAYLVAEIKNTFEMPLLQGNSVLFVDDQLVGRSYLNKTPVGESIELSLGVNENITVERIPGKQNEEDRGIFGKRTKISRQYFTTVENHSGLEQRIVLKDQFPVSQNEKIEVKTFAPEVSEIEFEANTGLFSWDLNLAANVSKEFETRFEVSFPEDWRIPQNF